jgi:hypothetical protein
MPLVLQGAKHVLRRNLEPWETTSVRGLEHYPRPATTPIRCDEDFPSRHTYLHAVDSLLLHVLLEGLAESSALVIRLLQWYIVTVSSVCVRMKQFYEICNLFLACQHVSFWTSINLHELLCRNFAKVHFDGCSLLYLHSSHAHLLISCFHGEA